MSTFWPLRGEIDGGTIRAETDAAAANARRARQSADELELRLERAMLANEAMWSLLREKLHLTDVDLAQRINEIDLSDGTLDGKVRKSAVSCPKCQRAIARRFNKCMYCGQMVVQDPFA